jgi:hypothetical protein
MAKIYNGSVSIIKNLKGFITVQADPDGKFTAANVDELYTTMLALAKKHKADCQFFTPEVGGDTPILFANPWGKPYMALLPARKAPGKVTVNKVTKLA